MFEHPHKESITQHSTEAKHHNRPKHFKPKNEHHLPSLASCLVGEVTNHFAYVTWLRVSDVVATTVTWDFPTEGKWVPDNHVGLRHLGEKSVKTIKSNFVHTIKMENQEREMQKVNAIVLISPHGQSPLLIWELLGAPNILAGPPNKFLKCRKYPYGIFNFKYQ